MKPIATSTLKNQAAAPLIQQSIIAPLNAVNTAQSNSKASAATRAASTQSFSTLTAKPSTATAVATQMNQPTELDEAAYTVALTAYKQGGAAKAIAPMKNFIKSNPNSVYISNAHFWLAEFYLGVDPVNFTEAKNNYRIVVEQYPKSARASRALYQLYNIAKDVDHEASLATELKSKLLKQYPHSEEAKYVK